jgi:Na+-transporting NADH:ubiquinone oxidoreductase subunit NqrB
MAGSPARTIGLVASVAAVIGAIGPWQTTFLVDFSGTDGDGLVTLILSCLAGALLLNKAPGSRWLALAGVLAGIAAAIAAYDLVQILTAEQEVLGRRVQLVHAGWGIWLTVIASLAMTAAAAVLWVAVPETETAE